MKIYVTRQIPAAGIEPLSEHEVEVYAGEVPIGRNELIEKLRTVDAVIPLLTDELDADILGYAKNLKVIANYAVGYDNIDMEEATERGIVVTNTPDVLTDATAELTWALIFAASRRLGEAERLVRSGNFKGWAPTLLMGQGIRGKTLGIIGTGRIGTRVAQMSRGLDMKIFYYDENRNETLEKEMDAKKVDISYLLHACDYVSIHLPLTRFTRHLIDAHQMFRMKPTAVLVNTSRGAIIDEKALAAVLKGGKIAAAGLDVYENEPEVAPELLKCENAILAPHIGSATLEARSKMAELCATAILDVFAGRIPGNMVNKEVWPDRRQ